MPSASSVDKSKTFFSLFKVGESLVINQLERSWEASTVGNDDRTLISRQVVYTLHASCTTQERSVTDVTRCNDTTELQLEITPDSFQLNYLPKLPLRFLRVDY